MPALLRLANDALNRVETRSRRIRLFSAPVEVTVEPTNACNSRCLMCLPYRRDPSIPHASSGTISLQTFDSLRPVLSRARRLLLGGFGEPLMHPRYAELLRRGKEFVPYVYFFTNGVLLDREMAEAVVRAGTDRVVVSIGGVTASTVEHVRGVAHEQVAAGLAELQAAKARLGSETPRLEFNVVQMRSVLPELRGIVDLALEYGAAHIDAPQMWVESPQAAEESVIGDEDALSLLEDAVAYARTRGITMRVSENPPTAGDCTYAWSNLFVAWDGTPFSCPSERYRMSVSPRGLLKEWRAGSYAELRRRLSSEPLALCPGCPVLDVAAYTDPAVHGRHVSEIFDATCGPAAVHSDRVMGGSR